MPTWVQKVGPDGKSVFVPKGQSMRRLHMVVGDIEDYESPIDGRPVSGRKQRREDLKRNGCVEYEPGRREHAIARREQDEQKLMASVIDRMRWHNA